MPVQLNGNPNFTYREKNTGSPVQSYTTDSMRLMRELFIAPGTIKAQYEAAKAFLGYPTVKTIKNNAGTVFARYVSRVLPDVKQWTDFTNALFAVSVNSENGAPPGVLPTWNNNLAVNEYAEALMTVEYRTTNYQIASDADCVNNNNVNPPIAGFFGVGIPDEGLMLRYIDRSWDYAGHITTIPIGVTAFSPDPGEAWTNTAGKPILSLPNKGGVPFREGMIELTMIHRELPFPAVPVNAIYNQLNTMNNSVFDVPFFNVPSFCALFTGAKPRIGKLITGEPGLNMEYKFLVAPHVVSTGPLANPNNPLLGGWKRALTIIPGNGIDYRELRNFWGNVLQATVPIQATDFSKLFRPPQS